MPNDLQKQINELKQDIASLKGEYYANNFVASQDFNKFSRFNTRIKLPVYASAPASCEVGEEYVSSANGKLYVCSAANTWTAQT
mgnify:CR=1 FL=1